MCHQLLLRAWTQRQKLFMSLSEHSRIPGKLGKKWKGWRALTLRVMASIGRHPKKVLRMLIEELSARLRGSTGTMSALEESKEVKSYSSIPIRKIADLLDIENEPMPQAAAEEKKAVGDTSTILYSLNDMRPEGDGCRAAERKSKNRQSRSSASRTLLEKPVPRHQENFRAYGALGGGAASTISRGEFATLMKDINVYDKSFNAAEADIIFLRSNWELNSETGELQAAADRSNLHRVR